MMTDYSLRVGIDISAYQVSATWGTMPDDEQPVVTVEQSSTGYRALIQRLCQTGALPGGDGSHRHLLDALGVHPA
jgi:hypothetical protein